MNYNKGVKKMDFVQIIEDVNSIKDIFICRATHKPYDSTLYNSYLEKLRSIYYNTNDEMFKNNFPTLILSYSSLDDFWQWIKREYDHYEERRSFVYEQFNPLRKYLESQKYKKPNVLIKPEITISNTHIMETVAKANQRIEYGDYDGAITTARTLLEEMESEIYRKLTNKEPEHRGDLIKLFKSVAQLLNLSIHKDLDGRLKEILSGLYKINNGISNLRNTIGDAHAKKFKPQAHHARLAVNCSFTFCQFLYDTTTSRNVTNRQDKIEKRQIKK
jgi:hypothetical protein